jgi:folylpolyglutamate synthase/dihydropteroate synthase
MAHESGYTGAIETIPDAEQAIASAEAVVGRRDLICITGSLSIVGEARTLLGLTPARAAYLDEAVVQDLRHNAR